MRESFGAQIHDETKLWSLIVLCLSRSKYARKEQWREENKVKKIEDSSCSLPSHFWSTFLSPFFTFYLPFQILGSQESNVSNRVRFGAEMRKIWPSEDNCIKLRENFAPAQASANFAPAHASLVWNLLCSADSTLDLFFCIFLCKFLSYPCN